MKLVSEDVVREGNSYVDFYLIYKRKDKEIKVRVRPCFARDYWRFKELCDNDSVK